MDFLSINAGPAFSSTKFFVHNSEAICLIMVKYYHGHTISLLCGLSRVDELKLWDTCRKKMPHFILLICCFGHMTLWCHSWLPIKHYWCSHYYPFGVHNYKIGHSVSSRTTVNLLPWAYVHNPCHAGVSIVVSKPISANPVYQAHWHHLLWLSHNQNNSGFGRPEKIWRTSSGSVNYK